MALLVGVDLGTTTTLIARAVEGEEGRIDVEVLSLEQKDKTGRIKHQKHLPSVAYYPKGQSKPVVGLEAERGPEEDASRYVRAAKRHMGRRVLLPVINVAPRDVSAEYLSFALEQARAQMPGGEMKYTVTVPASFTSNQRADTLLALRTACANTKLPYPDESDERRIFISEPVAAMLAFLNRQINPAGIPDVDLSTHNRVIVYDIGGGTLDLTLVFFKPRSGITTVRSLADLEIGVDAISPYNPFGGEDFDRELARWLHRRLLEQYPELEQLDLKDSAKRLGVRLQLMSIAKTLKESLALNWPASDPFSATDRPQQAHYHSSPVKINDKQYLLSAEITPAQYTEIVQELLRGNSRKSLITPLQDMLTQRGWEPDQLAGLLVVGGMARFPLIEETLCNFWGNPEKVWVFNPADHAVVIGAAIHSYLRERHPGFTLVEPAADSYYLQLKDDFELILKSDSETRGPKCELQLSEESDQLLLQFYAGEHAEDKHAVLATLMYQGSETLKLKKRYLRGTPVTIQMSYQSDHAGAKDSTKVPWVFVEVGDQNRESLEVRFDKITEARGQ